MCTKSRRVVFRHVINLVRCYHLHDRTPEFVINKAKYNNLVILLRSRFSNEISPNTP